MAGRKGTCEELLSGGSGDPNAVDAHGQTPVYLAALHGTEALVHLLLQHGGNPRTQNKAGRTPLHACADRHPGIVKLLVAAGAAVGAVDGFGRTAMHEAARKGHKENTVLLASLGCDIELADFMGRTPLQAAATQEIRKAMLEARNLFKQGKILHQPTEIGSHGRSMRASASHSGAEVWDSALGHDEQERGSRECGSDQDRYGHKEWSVHVHGGRKGSNHVVVRGRKQMASDEDEDEDENENEEEEEVEDEDVYDVVKKEQECVDDEDAHEGLGIGGKEVGGAEGKEVSRSLFSLGGRRGRRDKDKDRGSSSREVRELKDLKGVPGGLLGVLASGVVPLHADEEVNRANRKKKKDQSRERKSRGRQSGHGE